MKRLSMFLLLVTACAIRGGQPMVATVDPNHAAEIDALMHDYAGDVPGASVAVIQNGRTVFRRSYGFADLEARTPMTPDTNGRLASVTKQFTAAAVLLLAEDGKLSIDDPVRRFLPSLPSYADSIHIRHLLTHTSGLVEYEDVMPESTTEQLKDADVLRLLEGQQKTLFTPGSKYEYSNSGYAMLALIIERASGKSDAAFLHDRIFATLGMTDTVAYEKGISTVAHRAYGYSRDSNGFTRTDQSLTSAVLGDGGIYSSIDDLAKWDAALYDARLLRPESLRLAFTPWTKTGDPAVQYGFGWRVSSHHERRTLSHSGETRGFRNAIVRFPDQRFTVIILTNRNEGNPNAIALAIADLFL